MTPNPAIYEINRSYSFGITDKASLRITDMPGALVYHEDLGQRKNGNLSIQLSNFASVIYMVKFTLGNQKVIEKLVKE